MTDEQPAPGADRIRSSLTLKAKELAEAEATVEHLREQRRQLILLGRDAKVSYVQMAKDAGLSKPQVYKIVRDGYREAPVREWSEAPEAALA